MQKDVPINLASLNESPELSNHKRRRSNSTERVLDSDGNLVEKSTTSIDSHSQAPEAKSRKIEGTAETHHECLILHRVLCSKPKTDLNDHSDHATKACYRDVPRMFKKDTRGHALRGLDLIPDENNYLEDHEHIAVVIYRDYYCETFHHDNRDSFVKQTPSNMHQALFLQHRPWFYSLTEDAEAAKPFREMLRIVSKELGFALDALVQSDKTRFTPWNEAEKLTAPYNYFFHNMQSFSGVAGNVLSPLQQRLFAVLEQYIRDAFGAEYDEAEETFSTGLVSKRFFPKLFREKDVVVTGRKGYEQAYLVNRIPSVKSDSISLKCSSRIFDGTFKWTQTEITVGWPVGAEEISVDDLEAYPLRLNQNDLADRLMQRGKVLWECRQRKLVSYTAHDQSAFELHATNPKFMIDMDTHHYLHSEKHLESVDPQENTDIVEASQIEPPAEPFLVLLPPTILGFGFHDKKWRDLQIEKICEVPWNRKAFDKVVLNSQKKELIRAVVTEHLEKNRASDIVADKGNGLILLLHGPPGTGKTLTAESIAELAEKPLYRVTCGELGTEPQDVETLLDSALHVGSVWGCVVLLDEADVFLEERTQTDLVRNALVSVFLRVLEYYDGILLLTSNRVLTFDEAFKSRMQLAINYPVLDEDGREAIWINFFDALEEAKIDLNHAEMVRKARLLSKHKLNGRQIRNTIRTARQLAKFRGKQLTYDHLKAVIDIGTEFETYRKSAMGMDDEQYAKDQHWR